MAQLTGLYPPTGRCRNPECRELLPFGRLCPSCWWIAKVGFAAGTATLLIAGWLVGLASKWSFTLPAWIN